MEDEDEMVGPMPIPLQETNKEIGKPSPNSDTVKLDTTAASSTDGIPYKPREKGKPGPKPKSEIYFDPVTGKRK